MDNELPKPGSIEAIKEGCRCPVVDNHYGTGFTMDGQICFWYSAECLLHVPHGKVGHKCRLGCSKYHSDHSISADGSCNMGCC